MTREELAKSVARRLLSEIDDYGSLEDFCEKLCGFPEQYALDLAYAAVDHVELSGALKL
jgi:hypothetical protein